MQIVIDISDKAYEYAKTRMALFLDVNTEILKAVENGTVLPENHGDLIDRNALLQEPLDSANYASNYVRIAKAIIPATKGEENGN